jgi:hypothetical protein
MTKPWGAWLLRGLLLVWTLLIGSLGGLILLLSVGFGPQGFGGDGTMTADEVQSAQLDTLALWLVVLLTVAAFVVFVLQGKYRHPARVLAGIAALQMAVALLSSPWY